MRIAGRGGRTLDEAGTRYRTRGTASPCPEFPNMFLIYGPNTFGGSGSAIYMIESQMRHVVAAVRELRRSGARAIEVRARARTTPS